MSFDRILCRKSARLLNLVLLISLIGCGDEAIVVAQVGEVKLTRTDYEIFVGNLSGSQKNNKRDRKTQGQYLQSMVDQELLLLEARERRLPDEAGIKAELKFLTRRRLAELFQARVIGPRIEISQADLEREFVDSRLDRERLLSRILVRTPEDRDRVLAGLAEGRPFAAVLEPFAPNDAIAEGDGVVGWFNYADAERRFLIPRRIFFALDVDQVSEPVRLPRGWQIFRFLDERTPDLQDYYQEGRRLVQERQWQAANREDLELLKNKHAVKFHPQELTRLLEEGRRGSPREPVPVLRGGTDRSGAHAPFSRSPVGRSRRRDRPAAGEAGEPREGAPGELRSAPEGGGLPGAGRGNSLPPLAGGQGGGGDGPGGGAAWA